MRWATIFSAVLLAGLIFFSLCMAALDRDTQRYGHALDALDALDMVDTNLDNDVLKARIGLLRDYDSLVTGDARARAILQHLRHLADHDPALFRAIAALDADYNEKSLQRELFKSQNSLLSNSLAYFWSESSAQIRQGEDPAEARAASMLASAVQRLSLDTTGDAVALARRRLDEAAQRTTSAPLLPHGRMLLKLLPETDTTIRRMRPIASLASYGQLKTYLQQQQASQQTTARQVRFLLLALAIVMLGALLYLGKLLRQRARVLRRRAEFDRLMVAVSRRLVANDRHHLDAGIEAGLVRLAKWAKLPSARLGLAPVGRDARIWPDPPDDTFRAMLAAVASAQPIAASDVVVVDANGTVAVLGKAERMHGAQWLCLRQHADAGTVALLCLRLPPVAARRRRGLTAVAELLPQLHIALDTLFDALERRRLEDEALALEHRLELARRMETLGTMASGISHNFNNIVGAIRGNAEIALSKLDAHSPASEHLLEISHTTAHAYDLIESILSFGRVQNYNVQPVELNALLQGAVSLLSVSLPSTVAIDLQQEQEPLHALGNPAQLQQIILNLASNAAQAMDMRGTVTVQLSAGKGTATDGTPRRIAQLRVSDHGIGIPPDQLDRIFDLFFTTRSGGTGLGLATVRKIIDNHDGRIDVDSELGVGTSFVVELPLRTGSAAAPQASPLPKTRSRHASLLLLCDYAAELDRLEEMLAALGHEPVGMLELPAAVAMATADPMRFDGVLLKRDRAGDAERAIGALHAAAPTLPLILATRATSLATRKGLGGAITEIIAQPFDLGALAMALERALSRRMEVTTQDESTPAL
ncbi:two-component system VirA-like sensor kinase [Xanthomonas phaseoli]|uniref:two-component system VirA-like sensor kinase n=1 Tax=Xanthomonas phaseoli TaxID=1985254 RepID=UPI001237C6D9|nr:two-component system VirA-like sensor kinase [Xanthomonas phaseoli]MBO9831053.1 two-component system VirA-like sensor kinase [Xanthomonas phaseoli pv. dieffenbachiae]MBO9837388.1 two-component system VirA-like sensor kinase [Xanthomonas phaseoli pv. dieffenbachiae]MBO9839372.1 two-component system VirA-like sensor kinase [Xanthomonas phaseoli pv. dieffenbachiae]MBO9861023.1 two-component system VirA-like sensor kinase [Xanthomonas phaseoli pv. dieffenbachiae]MBO9864899.1 two-component syste